MKLINNKYHSPPKQLEMNFERLMEDMDLYIKNRFKVNTVSEFSKPIYKLRSKVRKVLSIIPEKYLMYVDDIILNASDHLVISWFRHSGTANISLVFTDDLIKVIYKKNLVKTRTVAEFKKSGEALSLVFEVMDSYPDVPKVIN